MGEKLNRNCKSCGKKYYYCPSCEEDRRETWHIMFDCEDCKNVFMLASMSNKDDIKVQEKILKELSLIKDFDLNNYSIGIVKELSPLWDKNKVTLAQSKL